MKTVLGLIACVVVAFVAALQAPGSWAGTDTNKAQGLAQVVTGGGDSGEVASDAD